MILGKVDHLNNVTVAVVSKFYVKLYSGHTFKKIKIKAGVRKLDFNVFH